jgi:hypothetical protein
MAIRPIVRLGHPALRTISKECWVKTAWWRPSPAAPSPQRSPWPIRATTSPAGRRSSMDPRARRASLRWKRLWGSRRRSPGWSSGVGHPALRTLGEMMEQFPGSEWYYGNVYDPRDGVTPLNW